MPLPNWHSGRVTSPKGFTKFRMKKIADGVFIVLGIKEGKSTTQAYRFEKKKFTAKQAREWLKKHNVKTIKFEKATNERLICEKIKQLIKENLVGVGNV